ncbi:MAG TPA: transketolase [archaeon]|nr:transketolase [archaeon]
MKIEWLAETAKRLRGDAIKMVAGANSGHPGGSLSALDLILTIYAYKLRFDAKNPKWEDRDRFVYSKGHACPGFYAVLAEFGFFPKEEFKNFRKINSLLQGHSSVKIPGVEFSAGSLGQGLSYANGIAMAGKIDKKDYRVYCVLGDGELQEGQIWEAAMTSIKYKLDNLTLVIDRNKIQNDDFVDKTKDLEPLANKWAAFGWDTAEIDGHNYKEIMDALDNAEFGKGRPSVIIAHTVKGKGVSFMENNPEYHGKAPSPEELQKALKELGVSA